MNTETLRKMSRPELEETMAKLDMFVEPDDSDDALRDFIVEELARVGERDGDDGERQEMAANEACYGGDSPGFYGPDDPGPGGR